MSDVSLVDFIGVKGKFAVWLPHTAGRYQAKSFRKVQCPIVERLITAMMFHGRNNGKKQLAQKIVKVRSEQTAARMRRTGGRMRLRFRSDGRWRIPLGAGADMPMLFVVLPPSLFLSQHTMEIIHLVTGANPLQIVADAVAKSGPREDSTRIGSSGVVRRQAVDVSPLRRVNQVR